MPKKSKSNYKISVIVPAYNEEKYIKYCLESILRQVSKDIEVIVINDGSIDRTQQIAEQYKINVYRITHMGSGYAKNYGAKFAKGDIFVFVDADMVLANNYIAKIILPIVKGESNYTYTTEEYVQNYNNIWAKCWQINSGLKSNKRVNKSADFSSAIRAIKKDVFFSLGGFKISEGYFDDRILEKEKYTSFATKAKCYHYNPSSLVEVFSSAKWIGKSIRFKKDRQNFIKYSIVNSIRNSIMKISKGAPIRYLLFKVFFDFGILSGMLTKDKDFSK